MLAWRHATRHLRAHYQHGGRAPALDMVVSLGLDRDATTALGLALSGARRVIAFDPASSLAPDRVVKTLLTYRRLAGEGRLPALDPDACARIDDALRCGGGRSAAWLLEAFGVSVRRTDARRSGLPGGSVDLLVCSDAPGHETLVELRRLAHEGAVLSQVVDRSCLAEQRALHRDARWIVLEEDPCVEPTTAWIVSTPAPERLH